MGKLMAKKNILITGSTGFIGLKLVNRLLNEGNQVYCIVRPDSKNSDKLPHHPHCIVIRAKLNEIETITQSIDQQIDMIYHLAWDGIRSFDRENESLQNQNYKNALAIMDLAIVLKVKKFIGIGSQAEYGIKENIDETTHEDPLSAYGITKQRTHHELEEIASKNNILFYWARIFSVYGPGDDEHSLINQCIKLMLKNEDVPLTQAIQSWDYLHIDDCVESLMSFAYYECGSGVYNIAYGESRPLSEYIELIKDLTHSTSPLLYGIIPYSSHGPVNLKVDTSKTRELLQWNPKISFEQGIKDLIIDIKKGKI